MSNLKDIVYPVLANVFSSMIGLHPVAGGDVSARQIGQGRSIMCTISIAGGWNGTVLLQCPFSLAEEISQRMFQADAGTLQAEEIRDALGEVINMVGGNLKTQLPGPSILSLPHVVVGNDVSWNPPHGTECHSFPAWCLDQPLLITIVMEAGSRSKAI